MATEPSSATASTGVVTVRGGLATENRAAAARFRMAVQVIIAERRALVASSRQRLLRSLAIASALSCMLFLLVLVLAPIWRQAIVRVELPPPPRTVVIAELIPEPPPAPAARPNLEQLSVQEVPDPPAVAEAIPEPPLPQPRRRTDATRQIDPTAAKVGRERARDATAALAGVTSALDRSLGELSSSLRASSNGAYEPSRRPRQRSVRSGRSDGQLAAVGNGLAGSGGSDLKGSKVEGSLVEIGTLAPARVEESGSAADGAKPSHSGPGVYRSNASLLAVIQKYAAGIQYCYENELKRNEGLKGKLVVALTVAAAGEVLDATVVQNTVGSPGLEACALSQIRNWRFPPIPEGLTTFRTPFVFTPPN